MAFSDVPVSPATTHCPLSSPTSCQFLAHVLAPGCLGSSSLDAGWGLGFGGLSGCGAEFRAVGVCDSGPHPARPPKPIRHSGAICTCSLSHCVWRAHWLCLPFVSGSRTLPPTCAAAPIQAPITSHLRSCRSFHLVSGPPSLPPLVCSHAASRLPF